MVGKGFPAKVALILILTLVDGLFGATFGIEKIPYRPQWVSVVKKGRLFKYKRKEFSSPRVFGDLVFAGADAGYLYAMKKRNGRKVWRFKTDGAINSEPAFWEGGGERRIFIGDEEGFLYAIDAKQGREIWRVRLGSEILTAPQVWGNRLFVATIEGQVAAVDLQDGRIVWEKEHALRPFILTIRGNSPPVVDEGGKRLYTGFADGVLWCLQASDGKLLWEKTLRTDQSNSRDFPDIDAPPLIVGDQLVVSRFEGGTVALSKKTGKVLWESPIGSGVRLLAEGDRLYIAGSDGILYALQRKDGSKIWETKVGREALTAPVIYKDWLAVGLSDSTMNFIRLRDGKIVARRFARKGIFSDPVVDQDKIYYLSNGGRLYSLKFVE